MCPFSALVSKFALPWLLQQMKVIQVGRLSLLCLLGGALLLLAGIRTHHLAWFLAAPLRSYRFRALPLAGRG
ncbi:MAG TPA: hypothetical protein VL832_11170 [Puia sp.]|nr:hypothetical protein [Puia sp.]